MSQETVRVFVESWTMCWTLVLGLGYIGRSLCWPALANLGSDGAARVLVAASAAAVLALSMGGFPVAGLSITGWAIGINLIRKTVYSPE